MTSPPLDSTHGCQRQAWHDIIAVGQHTRSNDVERGMISPPFDSTHDQTASGVACHHRLLATQTVERHRSWHAIITIGQHKWSNDVRRGMISPPLDNTHSRTTLGVACHHRHWKAHTVERRQAWHDITGLGLHARSDDVGRGMTSPPLHSTHGRQRRA